jgi:endonuclease/exonuclease/phosphatase family metal-dependent hydrolase
MKKQTQLDVSIMTFNIRCDTPEDGDNRWDNRKEFACDIVRERAPDVVGLQEANRHQLDVFTEGLPEYVEVGVGREGDREGEYAPILYKSNRFNLAASGTFWLSKTPDKPSRDWESACLRICTWVQFYDKASKQTFFVYNTHLDHKSQLARMNGIELIMKRMSESRANHPAILMGDFNAEEDNPVIAFLNKRLSDTFRVRHPNAQAAGTCHAFGALPEAKRIDYIFATLGTRVLDAEIIRTKRAGRYPSDHFPVIAELRLGAKGESR